MARYKADIPSIFHLKLLMELYAKAKEIDLSNIESVKAAFQTDQIIEKASDNFINKFLGWPYHSTILKAEKNKEGIDEKYLDIISRIVFERYNLSPNQSSVVQNISWIGFQNRFKIPERFENINDSLYYRYLSKSMRDSLDSTIEKIILELTSNNNDLHFYCVYYWNDVFKKVDVGIMEINQTAEIAKVSFLHGDLSKPPKSVQTTNREGGVFKLHRLSHTLYINLIDEDDKKSHIRTNICLGVHDTEFYDLPIIKGTYSSSRKNAGMPVAGIILVEKKPSKSDVEATLVAGVNSSICFELLNQRITVDETKFIKYESFKSYFILNDVINRIKGAYVLGFFSDEKSDTGEQPITIGVCFIEANGRYKMRIGDVNQTIEGFIDNDIYHDSDVVCLTNYVQINSRFKYRYVLKLIKSKPTSSTINELHGIYLGISKTNPRAGNVAFLRKSEYNTFDDIANAMVYKERVTDMNLDDNVKRIYKALQAQPYWISGD